MQSNVHVQPYTLHFIAMPGTDYQTVNHQTQIMKLSKVEQNRCGQADCQDSMSTGPSLEIADAAFCLPKSSSNVRCAERLAILSAEPAMGGMIGFAATALVASCLLTPTASLRPLKFSWSCPVGCLCTCASTLALIVGSTHLMRPPADHKGAALG